VLHPISSPLTLPVYQYASFSGTTSPPTNILPVMRQKPTRPEFAHSAHLINLNSRDEYLKLIDWPKVP
jgi:hypothetical protein